MGDIFVKFKLKKMPISFQLKIIATVLIFVFVPYCILSIYTQSISKGIIQEKIIASTQKNLAQTSIGINELAERMAMAANIICKNTDLSSILSYQGSRDQTKEIKDAITINELCENVHSHILPAETDVIVLTFDGNAYGTRMINEELIATARETDWFHTAVQSKTLYSWFQVEEEDFFVNARQGTMLGVSRVLTGVDGKSQGLAIILLRMSHVLRLLQSMIDKTEESVDILNDDGLWLVPSELAGEVFDGDLMRNIFGDSGHFNTEAASGYYLVNYVYVEMLHWYLVVVSPNAFIFRELQVLNEQMLLVNLVFLFVFGLITLLLIRHHFTPLQALTELVRQIRHGNLAHRIRTKSYDELGLLGRSLNDMLDRIGELLHENEAKQQELAQKELEKEKMRYLVLQSQVNPHFLLNTLNNIKWLATIYGDSAVSSSIVALGQLLEASFRQVEDEITLRQEIHYLNSYIRILELSYPAKFEVHIDITHDVLDCAVPKLFLQPLFENAVIHGLSGMLSGRIDVEAHREGDILRLSVTDNGIGIDEETAERLNSAKLSMNKLGINNTNQRIQLLYGPAFGLRFEKCTPSGTKVTIRLPNVPCRSEGG